MVLIILLGLALLLLGGILLAIRIETKERKELFKRIRETKHAIDLTKKSE